MPKVYVVNKSHHDFSKAEPFGELVYLSEGKMARYEVNNMARQFATMMANSTERDFILMSGLSMMNTMACVLFAIKHRRLNLLLYKNNNYIERNLVFDEKGVKYG